MRQTALTHRADYRASRLAEEALRFHVLAARNHQQLGLVDAAVVAYEQALDVEQKKCRLGDAPCST